MQALFSIWRTEWSPTKGWLTLELTPPATSDTLVVLGSGEYAVMEQALAWKASAAGGTSRAVFSAFCDALRLGKDPHSGGAPQLVGLYRRGAGITFGIIWEQQKYLLGRAVDRLSTPNTVEWRNALLERCDGVTGERLPYAQPHLRPLTIPGA